MSRISALLCVVTLAFAGTFARAEDPAPEQPQPDAQTLFTQAKTAFDAADYSRARALFEQALAAGMDGPAIHYNIGVAAYRAGDLPRAERAFREVARTPSMAALANYNLGLVALDRRDDREAREWFQRTRAHEHAGERLTTLANRRLDELPHSRAPGSWSWYARGGAGHDDNIALRSESVDSSATGDEDSFADTTLAVNYITGPWRFDAGASLLEYTKLDDFSQSSLYLGAARGLRLDRWYVDFGAYGSQFSFGGEVFERNIAAGLLATRLFQGGSRLRAQLRAADVDGHGRFDGLTGNRAELGLYFDKAWRSWTFGAHTRAERNESADPIFATRWVQIGAETRYAWNPLWQVSLGAAARRTTRPALSDTSPGWEDDRLAWQVAATRALWRQAQLYVRYDHEQNQSPVPGFDYGRNRLSASVEFWY